MRTSTILLASAGVGQAFMPVSRPGWTARSVEVRAEFEGAFMPSETPEVYKSETKKMLSAMEGYIKGAEAIAAEGSTSFDTEFATVPTVPDLVKDLFGEKSEAFKISEEVSGSSGAGVSGSAAVSDLKDTVGYSSEYSADYCDVAIWWRAPEVVKARWGADSKSYKMAQAAADQLAEQSTEAQLDADWDALWEFDNTYAGGIPSISADAVKGLGEEERAMFAAMDKFKPATPSLSDAELAGDFEPEWATAMREEDDKLLLRLREKLGTDPAAYDTEKWSDEDPLGKIGTAFGKDSQTYKDAQANMAAFANPPTAAEFDESLKELLGQDSESYKAVKAKMSAPPAKEAAKAE